MFGFCKNIVSSAWGINSKRSCCLVFLCQCVSLLCLLCIGFIYVHVFVPNYNAKRLSKTALVCSTTSNELIQNCELSSLDDLNSGHGGKEESTEKKDREHHRHSRQYEDRHLVEISEQNGTITTEKYFKWSSCGEFCSPNSVEKFGCRELRVDVRSPGSDFVIEKCRKVDLIECGFPKISSDDDDAVQFHRKGTLCPSGNDTSCLRLGLFECHHPPTGSKESLLTPLSCSRIEGSMSCDESLLHKDTISIFNCSSSPSCFKKPGIYICDSAIICKHIKNPDDLCTRRCDLIDLEDKNVVVTDEENGKIITAECSRALHTSVHSHRRSNLGKTIEVWPRGFKHKLNPLILPTLLINCNHIEAKVPLGHSKEQFMDINLQDCFNGTLLENMTLPVSSTLPDLRALWYSAMKTEDFLLDPIQQKYAPPEGKLSVFNHVPLYILDFYKDKDACDSSAAETEECVNFYELHGRLPGDVRGQSIFSCFCRNIQTSTYCVVSGKKVFPTVWEEDLVHFVDSNSIVILIFLFLIFIISLLYMFLLLYPLITDKVVVGYSPSNTPTVRNSRPNSIFEHYSENQDGGNESTAESRRNSLIAYLTPVKPLRPRDSLDCGTTSQSLFEKKEGVY